MGYPKGTALAGFGSADLEEALVGERPMAHERVEAHVLFTAPADATPGGGIWAVLDFMDFDLHVVNTIKSYVVAATGIKLDNIHVLTTHNHGAGEPELIEKLAMLTAEAAKQAIASARPAMVRGVQIAMPDGINYRRRIEVSEFQGMWTTFAGPDMHRYRSAAGFIEAAIQNINRGNLTYFGWQTSTRSALKFEPGDPNFFLMEFKDAETGTMLGTLSRFAMHAIMRSQPQYYSSDYPWYIRQEIEKSCGGSAVFMNGPCGELAPCFPYPDKKSGIERIYAEQMVSQALPKLKKTSFKPLITAHDNCQVKLPVRKEILDGKVSLDKPMPSADDLPARKRWLERERLSTTLSFLEEKYRNGENSLTPEIGIELGLLRLGEWLLLAYPGETFSVTAQAVTRQFPKLKLVSITEHGRTVMYLPPQEDYLAGGYESICAVTTPEAEEILRNAAIQMIRKQISTTIA